MVKTSVLVLALIAGEALPLPARGQVPGSPDTVVVESGTLRCASGAGCFPLYATRRPSCSSTRRTITRPLRGRRWRQRCSRSGDRTG